MLLEDRKNLVDERLDSVVTGILTLLLQRSDQLVVIRAGLLEKKPIEDCIICRPQFLFGHVHMRAIVWPRSRRRCVVKMNIRPLGSRKYRLIDSLMVFDQLICVMSNLAG